MMNPRNWALLTGALLSLYLVALAYAPAAAFEMACASLLAFAVTLYTEYWAGVDRALARGVGGRTGPDPFEAAGVEPTETQAGGGKPPVRVEP